MTQTWYMYFLQKKIGIHTYIYSYAHKYTHVGIYRCTFVYTCIRVDSIICTRYDLDLCSPNDVGILKPKVGLGLDQIEINLRKVFSKKYNSFIN